MFELNETDLIGMLTGFPIEVAKMMIVNQIDQGNAQNVRVFQEENRAARATGGFNWEDTAEGFDFWSRVIGKKQWSAFFDKYPHTLEMPSVKKAKTLKAPRKMHFTKAQKWCLERMLLNTKSIHNRLKAILNENLRSTPYFDFPILTSEIDEALKLFCLERYDSESLDNKIGALHMRIIETLTSIYYMNQALMYDNVRNTIYIWDKKLKGVRSALNWAKKNYGLLDKMSYVRFGGIDGYHTTISVIGKVSGIAPGYKYDKSLGAYRHESRDYNYILGNILLHIN
jgi:hypothetical protein